MLDGSFNLAVAYYDLSFVLSCMSTVSLSSLYLSPFLPPFLSQRPANPNPNPVRKNHACETCGKAFRDVYHLNRHRLSHSDEKPFSCPVCQQRFKRKDRMSHHVRSHQGGVEKPYVCPHCSKAFSRSATPHAALKEQVHTLISYT